MEKFLPEICTIQYGFPFDSSKFSTSEGMPLIRIRDVVRGYSETFTTEEYKEEYIVNKGDLLIGMDGEFNIARWGETPALLNQRVCRLLPTPEVDKNYLFYFMPSALKRIEEKTPFVTVKHLSARELNKVSVPLPPLEEQRRIANLLDKVSDLIAKRRVQLDNLDLLVKARFVEMFGDVEANPMNWPTSTIGAVVDSIEAGWSGNGSQRERQPGEIAVLKVSAVTKGYFIPSECKVLDDQENIKKYVFPKKGDLLFSRANTREMVGATAVISEDYPELILPDKLWKIRFVDSINVHYMKQVLSSKSVREKFSAASTGTSGSMYNVSMDKFKKIKIPVPPADSQDNFSQFVEQTEQIKNCISCSLSKLETLRKALMQEFF